MVQDCGDRLTESSLVSLLSLVGRNGSSLLGVKGEGVALSVPIAPLLAAVSFIAPEHIDLDNLEVLRLSLGLEGEKSDCILDKWWANVVGSLRRAENAVAWQKPSVKSLRWGSWMRHCREDVLARSCA